MGGLSLCLCVCVCRRARAQVGSKSVFTHSSGMAHVLGRCKFTERGTAREVFTCRWQHNACLSALLDRQLYCLTNATSSSYKGRPTCGRHLPDSTVSVHSGRRVAVPSFRSPRKCRYPQFASLLFNLDAQSASNFKSNTLAISNRSDSNHCNSSCDFYPLFDGFRAATSLALCDFKLLQSSPRFQSAIWASKCLR